MSIYTRAFWRDASERAYKSAAQAAILALGGGAFNLLTLDWFTVGGAAGGGLLLSLLTSIASAGATGQESASLRRDVLKTQRAEGILE